MRASRAIIMTLVMRSRPFCTPKLQTKKPITTTMTIKMVISPGEESIWL